MGEDRTFCLSFKTNDLVFCPENFIEWWLMKKVGFHNSYILSYGWI